MDKPSFTESKELTLAILPFEVRSDLAELKNLGIGFGEDLVINLSRFNGISVIAQYSLKQLHDLSDVTEIARLGADFLISGSIRSLGSQVRITFQLINLAQNAVIYAGHHDEDTETLFEAMDSVIQQIVNLLQQQIDCNLLAYSYPSEKKPKVAAYVNWLKGMEELKQSSPKHDLAARKYFEEALKIDPTYARAYTGMSLSFFNEWSCLLWDRWDLSHIGAQKYALKALELDENDYEALMILGRTYLFSGEYEKSEYCLRKSVKMNPNDARNLVYVAFWMTYLGYVDEASQLFQRACQLNPLHQDYYFAYGMFIFFELGEFEKSIEMGLKVRMESSWADFPAFMAANYYHLNDLLKCREYWSIFLKMFDEKIFKEGGASDMDALQWHIHINPYRTKSNIHPFWEYMNGGAIEINDQVRSTVETKNATFLFSGEIWELIYQDHRIVLKDAKGLHDIAYLLQNPEKPVHCYELMGTTGEFQEGTPMVDQRAKSDYHQRIRLLQEEISEAESMSNYDRLAVLNEEYDQLIHHLSSSLGLGGKSRKAGSPLEKARTAVTWRIRNAIKKIEQVHPELARHLSRSIQTGTTCQYTPELEVRWLL